MNKGICLICSGVTSRTVNILNTHLLAMYEKLTDLKVSSESHNLCFICKGRLQQCYQLQQLTVKQKPMGFNKKQNTFKYYNPIQTSISKLLKMTIPCQPEMLVEKKIINAKQEVAEVKCLLEVEPEQHKLKYLQKHEIKIENDFFDCQASPLTNDNYSEIGEDAQLLQNYQFVDVKLEEINKDNILNNDISMNVVSKCTSDLSPYEASRNNKISECGKNTKSYVCDICKKSMTTKYVLIVHLRTHTGEKPYQCNICNKRFGQKFHLAIHKRIHTDDRPYSCNVCKKTFTVSKTLTVHQRTHSGNRPYTCNVCNKTFFDCGTLIRHKRIHTGDRPYSCDVCNKTFSDSTGLKTHKRIHTGEKPYGCDVCNRQFSTNSSLIRHKRTHTGDKPYVCDVCNRKLSTNSSLIRHKRTHTGDKPYSCDVCNKTFSVSNLLLRHKRRHI